MFRPAASVRVTLRAFLLCFVAVTQGALAQGTPPTYGRIPDPYSLDPGYMVTSLAGGRLIQEWRWRNDYLLLVNNPSLLGGRPSDLAPHLFYRHGDVAVHVGSGRLPSASPFNDSFNFRGIWVGGERARLTWSLWGGRTENVDQQMQTGVSASRPFHGASVGFRASSWFSMSAGVMRYAARDRGEVDHTLAALQAFASDRRYWSLQGAFGQDFGTGFGSAGDRRAWKLDGTMSRRKFSASLFATSTGRQFGPLQEVGQQSGQTSVNAMARYDLASGLSSSVNYRLQSRAPLGLLSPGSSQNSVQGTVSWVPSPDAQWFGGLTENWQSGGPRSRDLILQGTGRAGIVALGANLARSDLDSGGSTSQVRMQVGLPLGSGLQVGLDGGLTTSVIPGSPLSRTVQTGLTLQSCASSEGRMTWSLQHQRLATGGPGTGSSHSTNGSLQYHVAGPLWVTGGVAFSSSGGASSTALIARLRWVPSENTELSLQHAFSSSGQTILVDGRSQLLRQWLTLNLSTSFGGPLQERFRHDRLGRLRVKVLATPALRDGASSVAVPGVTVRMGQQVVRTDARGTAALPDAPPGEYAIEVDGSSLGRNMELAQARRTVHVAPAEDAVVTFRPVAWSSIYVVTFNDEEGKGSVGEIYVPFAGIRVEVDGREARPTGDEGNVQFPRLSPGRHRLRVVPSSIPPGLQSTTPLEREVDVAPGGEAVIPFGFRGYGWMEGRALMVANGDTRPSVPLANLPVQAGGRAVGETDAEGRFRVRLPAGRHIVSIDPAHTGGQRYDLRGAVSVEIAPDQTVKRDIELATLGSICVRLMRAHGTRPPVPLPASGVVVEFSGDPSYLYTDDNGQAQFRSLKIGRYRVTIDATSLPPGSRLVGAARQEVNLASGDDQTLEFILQDR